LADRVIRDELLTSERYWKVSIEAQRLFIHLLLNADDTARFSGKNYTIRASCFPTGGVDPDRVERLLTELSDADLIRLYTADDQRFMFIPRFRQKIRYVKSRYPAPPAGIDDTEENAIPDVSQSEWLKIRQEILARDEYKCLRCGSKEKLSVDHIVARANGGKSLPENLVTLCTSCNSWKRTNEHRSQEIITLMKSKQCPSSAEALPKQRSSRRREVKRSEENKPPLPPLEGGRGVPPENQKTNGAWWQSEPETLAKAIEVGITPRPGEDWGPLRSRIRAAINTKKEVA